MKPNGRWLLTADIHLSGREQDKYRFGLFKWLRKQQKEYDVTATYILGDVTQEKDNHSSYLVNRTIEEIRGLRPPLYIVRGNHDGIDPNNPFFKFLNHMEGIHFAVTPSFVDGVALLPHCRTQAQLDEACKQFPDKPLAVMAHQTFEGAIAETGARLSGLRASPIEALRPGAVYAGDVHRPQNCGPVTYVGAPYQVRFGDDYEPRVLLVEDGGELDLHYTCLRKWALTITNSVDLTSNINLAEGDQVKITVVLKPEEIVHWIDLKQRILAECKEMKLEVHGIKLQSTQEAVVAPKRAGLSKSAIFKQFCVQENVPVAIAATGEVLLNEGSENENAFE